MLWRQRVVLALATAGVVVVTGACAGAAGESTSASTRSTTADAAAGSTVADTLRQERRRRPGCRQFCQQAGGFGGGGDPDLFPVQIHSQSIRVARDRIIGVRATCALDTDCVGAILINNRHFEYGRADLVIAAHTTRKVQVGVSRSAVHYLESHGADTRVFATVPLIDEQQPVSISDWLTVRPPR